MKTIVLLIGILISGLSSAQTMNDTLVYTSGEKEAAHIIREGKHLISYRHMDENGEVQRTRVRRGKLQSFAIYDENNKLVTKSSPNRSKGKFSDGAKSAIITTVAVIGGAGLVTWGVARFWTQL